MALAAGAVLAALAVPAAGQASSAPALMPMAYGKYSFELPRSWPVINLSAHPRTCVRFDRQVVYIGTPSPDQSCPARLIGTTQALLIRRGPARAARTATENPVARQITVTAPGISITATYGADPGRIDQILRSASLPEPSIQTPAQVAAGHFSRARVARLPHRITNYHGLGFDACTAPSPAYMSAWRRRSPYRAVGVYIGGSDRACAQPNLTASWLRSEAAAGWRFFPLYVGAQAEFGELKSPAAQGAAAATDAVAQARLLGFRRRTPLYYDMEAYAPRQSAAALTFLSAWTLTVHHLGFDSGVYSSSLSGIEDLAQQYFTGVYAVPDVIYDALWNNSPDTVDPVFAPGEWTGHRRLHQFNGNVEQTFGGDKIDVDQDYLNVRLGGGPVGASVHVGTAQASPSVRGRGGVVNVFYRGPGRRLWQVRYQPGAGWEQPVDLGGSVRSAPAAVSAGGGRLDVFYQGTDGGLWQAAYQPRLGWHQVRLRRMGALGGAPAAVAESSGVIDVFWSGSAGSGLRHGRFTPRGGWTGPQPLGGRLASAPSPVEPVPGRLEVFWQGTDRGMWQVTSDGGASWSSPARLRMGSLGGAAQATAGPGGAVYVAWRGAGNMHLYFASASPAGRWSRPHNLGGSVSLPPFPVAPAAGVVRVFWRGQDGRLWAAVRGPGSGWLAPAALPKVRLGSAPFVTIGEGAGKTDVFWRGSGGALWATSLGSGGRWAGPLRLGR
jgi:Domain of unknown function (DUF1906)